MKFCGKCGKRIELMDLITTVAGRVAVHYVHCPSAWGVAFRAPIVTVFPDGG